MYKDRLELYKKLEAEFDTKLLVYVTSDRPNMTAQIASDVIDFFIYHLDKIGPSKKISLYLYTRGGDTSAARNIVNLLRIFCDNLQVIIPHKAHSSGTLISIGANELVMTKQATLGPIDPSVNAPLNPRLPNGQPVPVSVEAVKGYLEFAKNELHIKDDMALAEIYKKLTDFVNPLVLGDVYRSRAQIQMMAEKLLDNQVQEVSKKKRIIEFLCSESGSHDYTINRREAKEQLGLNVVKPTDEQYNIIKRIYDDISEEMLLGKPFFINEINGAYSVRRCILESVLGGSDYYSTEGTVIHGTLPGGQNAIQDDIRFSGWRHEKAYEDEKVLEINEEGAVYERSDIYTT